MMYEQSPWMFLRCVICDAIHIHNFFTWKKHKFGPRTCSAHQLVVLTIF